MNYSSLLKNRKLLLGVLLISAMIICAGFWASRAHAQNELTIDGPKSLKKKETFTVTDPSNTSRQFKPANFTKVEVKPAGIVTVKPTETNGGFEVTPVNTGKATLTIEYVEDSTTLKGIRELFVPYKSVTIKENEPVKLLMGQTEAYDVFGIDFKGEEVKITEAEAQSHNEDFVKASFSGQQLKLDAQNPGSAEVVLTVLGISYTLKIEVAESIAKIEIDNRGAVSSGDVQISIPEGETRQLKVKVVGSKGTEFKRSDVPLETKVEAASDTCGAPVEATFDDRNENILNVTAPILTGGAACTKPTRSITLRIEDIVTIITITITQKIGFIRLTASSPILSQNGRITITADVFDRNNIVVPLAPDVSFRLREPDKDKVWVSIVKEGNKATLVSRNPTPKEIRVANDNELVTRPSEVVVIATTRLNAQSPEIESQIIIRLAEVIGFDLLKVKLNLMDERTAADLYGKVTSDEYYVLTVRLFNNLKNERTQTFDGNSILAYSSSIEVAVGLEKRFDRGGSDSYFPYVISKSDAKRIAQDNATGASDLLADRSAKEIEAMKKAQNDLDAAVGEQYKARQEAMHKLNDALEKKVRAEQLIAIARSTTGAIPRQKAFDKANGAITEYNDAWVDAQAALRKANDLEEQVSNYRRVLAKNSAARVPVRQDLSRFSDPDTAIDDGLWHPLAPADLNRLGQTPAPSPTESETASGSGPLQLLSEAELRGRPARATSSGGGSEPPPKEPEDQDPPCAGVITYRPFTFEMMVNTVDRRDNRSVRSKVFRVLDLLGTGTSFATSIWVPGPNSDLPLGLEKYRNLLLPSLDKIYPNYKEQQRQNIVSQAMKEIEEIPFGSDITRVIFVPKKNIHGLVRGHDVRISEVCPYFFRIQVAIVSKKATAEQGEIR